MNVGMLVVIVVVLIKFGFVGGVGMVCVVVIGVEVVFLLLL